MEFDVKRGAPSGGPPGSAMSGRRGEPHHFAWFDVLRCAAVLLVITAHCPLSAVPRACLGAFAFFSDIGWVGVDLFFVLSGFLVSGLLFVEHQQSGRIDASRFLVRRALKIVPSLYFLVLVTFMVNLFTHEGFHPDKLVHEIFFLQSYREGYWPHTWTLGVEVQFYLLCVGLLVFLASRTSPPSFRWLPSIIFALFILCLIGRLVVAHETLNVRFHQLCTRTHLRVDSLAAGVLLRYGYEYAPGLWAKWTRHRGSLVGVALLLVLPSEMLWKQPPASLSALMPTFNYVGFCSLLAASVALPIPALKTGFSAVFKAGSFVGKHSYSIYLWHLPVKEWMVSSWCAPVPHSLFLPLYFLGSLAVGILLSELLEMPVLRLRNRLFPRRSS
jgi:peptidoglycan/LPS O-acetylase OafA/YrhL